MMRNRGVVFVALLVCGAITIAAVWQVLSVPRDTLPALIAWAVLVISAPGFLWLLWRGLRLNTERAREASSATAATTKTAPTFFPAAPDPTLARDAIELLRVPPESRDAAWEPAFYAAMQAAALMPAEPAEFTGPDQMPYAAFRLSETPEPSTATSMRLAAELLTERGLGAVLNPHEDGTADWVFTTGDLLSLRLFGQFTAAPPPDFAPFEAADAAREVLAASPSEEFLPAQTRALIRTFMRERVGVAEPKVFLIVDAAARPPESFVFNVGTETLGEGWTVQGALRYIGWYLPRHYRAIAVPLNSTLAEHFQPL